MHELMREAACEALELDAVGVGPVPPVDVGADLKGPVARVDPHREPGEVLVLASGQLGGLNCIGNEPVNAFARSRVFDFERNEAYR